MGAPGQVGTDTRTQRRGILPAPLPGLALHNLSLRHETHPGESALPLGLRYVTMGQIWDTGFEGHLGMTPHLHGQPHNISTMVNFLKIYFNG